MANADKTLLNKDNLEIYPLTRERNVYDENNVNLKEKFKTVVFKDNEVHQFAQELYEESANIAPLENKEYGGSFSNTWDSFTIPLLQNLTLKAGKKYSWSAKIKSSDSCRMNKLGLTTNAETLINLYDYGSLTNNYITVSKTFTPTTDINVNNIYVHNATIGSVDIKEIMVVEGDLIDYKQYNPNRHITNSEAEFLKEEHEKSANELDFSDVEEIIYRGLTYSFKDNVLTLNGTTEGIVDRVFYLNSQVNANGNYVFSGNNSNISGGSYFTLSTDTDTPLQLNSTVNKSDKANVSNLSIKSLHMYLDSGVTYNNFKISFSLIKGDLEGYLPYNSSSHITNSQADLLKSEWEKSVNLFNEKTAIGNVNNNTGVFTYTSTGNNLLSVDYMPMKPSTVYSYKTSKNGLWIYEYDSNRNYLGMVDIVSGSSFTSKSNTSYFRVAFWGGYGTTYSNDTIVKEGTNPVYHQYNGSILHEKDIEPVLLWENASGTSFGNVGENLLMSKIPTKQVAIMYTSGGGYNFRKIETFYFNNGWEGYLSCNGDYGNAYRKFKIQNQTLIFYDAYVDGAVNNSYLIPIKAFEINMLWEG